MGLKLLAEVGLDGSGFEKGITKLSHNAGHHLKSMVVGAFGFYAIEQAIHKTIETAEELVNTSKRLGTTVEQLQLIRQAAKEGGTEMSAFASAMEKLNVARGKIAAGDKSSSKLLASFGALGVSKDQLKNQTAASLLIGPIRSTVEKGNVEMLAKPLRDILGKGFGEIIPVLKTDFEELSHKMNSMGLIMSTETAVGLHKLGNEFSLISRIMIVQLGPAILKVVEVLLFMVGKVKEMAAFYGGLTSKLNGKDILKSILLGNPITGAIDLAQKFDKSAAIDARDEQRSDWKTMIDAMAKQLQDEADALKEGKPPGFDIEDPADKAKKQRKFRQQSSDSLVTIGNFLGTAGNSINRIAERQVALLQQIANNTKPSTLAGSGSSSDMAFSDL